MIEMPPSPPKIRTKRSSHRLRWAVSAALFILAVTYVSMPWWLPTHWLTQRITQQLVEALHRPVTIGKLYIGWIDGVVIEDLVIGERPGSTNTQLAAVDRFRCDFNPLTTLFTGRVDRIELVSPQIWLVLDEAGQITNLVDLQNQRAGGLPALRYNITKASCHLIAPHTAPQTVLLDQIDCEIFPETGLLRVMGWTVVPRLHKELGPAPAGRFQFDARITVARLNPSRALGGQVSAEWTDLALTDLPQPFAARVPIQQLEGLTSGKILLTPQPDLAMNFQVAINLNGVKILRPGAPKPAQIPDANLRTEGRWDPNTDKIALQDFEYETAALHIHRKKDLAAPAITIDPRGSASLVMHFAGLVKDWAAFRREFPEIDQLTGTADANLTGSAEFTLSLTQEEDQDRFVATVDATPSRWLLRTQDTDWLAADAGLQKTLHIEAVHNRQTRQVSQPQVLLKVGDLTLALQSELVLPAPDSADWLSWFAEALPTLGSSIEIKTEHVEGILQWLPFTQHISGLAACKGPIEMHFSLDPVEHDSLIKMNVDLKPETTLEFGRAFTKPAGVPLSIQAAARIPHAAAGEWHALQFDLITGRSRIGLIPERSIIEHKLSSPKESELPFSSLQQLIARGPGSFDAHLDLTIHAAHCEDWLQFFPLVQSRSGRSNDIIAGNAEFRVDSRLSFHPDDWCLTNGLTIKADNLNINAGEFLQKPAGGPFDIELNHRVQSVGQQLETTLTAALQNAAGRVTATTILTDRAIDCDQFEHAVIEADINDVVSWSALSPALHLALEPYRMTGPVSFQVSSLLLDGAQNVSLEADLSATQFTIPDDAPFEKSAGIPARLALHLKSPPLPREDSGGSEQGGVALLDRHQQWQIHESSHFQLAGAQANQLAGNISLIWPKDIATLSINCLQREPLTMPSFESAKIEIEGDLAFDPQLASLHPKLRELSETYALSGKTRYVLALFAKPDGINLVGHLDAQPIAFTYNLDNAMIPRVHKAPSMPANLAFDLSLTKAPSNDYVLDIRDATLELDGNTFTAAGIANLRANSPLALAETSVSATASMLRPETLTAYLPGSTLAPLAGSGQATIKFEKELSRDANTAAKLTFKKFTLRTPAEPLQLDGTITMDAQNIDVDQLRYKWGPSAGTAASHLTAQNGGYTGHVGLAIERLNLIDLQQKFAACTKTAAQPQSEDPVLIRSILDTLSRSSIDFHATTGSLDLTLPLDVVVQVDSASANAKIENGGIDLSFRCLVDGGITNGTFKADTASIDPSFHLRYTSERIQPGPLVDRYLLLTFPGMKATGPLTLIDESKQKFLPAAGEDNYPVGKGEIIIEGGTVEGRAAPVWVTKIYPGLNLAKFEFSYMHSWFEKFSNGRARHQMIFQGRFYNIYTIGYSEPDGRIDYEIGIDFLADFNSKYWAEAGQGRIPLFTKTGRKLPDGQLVDEVVSYIPPQRIFETLLVRNNPVFTAYHAIRKRVLKEQ